MPKKFYITTACPYVNAAPHVGHSLEFAQADVIARYHRLLGDDTYFLTGSDENSLKNVRAAEELGISTIELCNKNSQKFYQFKNILNISFDNFFRTTEEKHIRGAQKLWLSCKKEDIYKKPYNGLYCVGCEVFYSEDELVDGKCPEHLIRPEFIEEENYFFRLSSYQDKLEKLILRNELTIIPEIRKNEVLSFIRRGLEDFSISRSVERAHGWGICVPNDSSQIIYVWFDALAYYLTALGYGTDEKLLKRYWPVDLHVIGKGITRFHAIYWPAMLLSAGLPLPKAEFVHGYVTVEGQKISKSLGNVIDPFALVEKYGTDAVRYYLLKEIPAYGDGDFSERRFKELYNSDLANGLGNLVSRVAKLCENEAPRADARGIFSSLKEDKNFEVKVKNLNNIYRLDKLAGIETFKKLLEEFKFNEAFGFIWEKISQADKYVDTTKPWTLKEKRLDQVLEHLVAEIIKIAALLSPFLPETAERIKKQFSGKIKSHPALFPRLGQSKPA